MKENHVLARAMYDNGNVWEDSCVEIFIADKDNEHYYNFEINCVATLLAARRLSVHSYNFIDAESFKKIIRYSSLPHCPIDRKGENVEWSMIVGIPYSVMGFGCKPEWLRANFYKCGDATEVPHFLSWNAIDTESPNFHQPEFFGKLVF